MVSVSLVKELREETGLSVMLVKRALEQADGDIPTAREILEKEFGSIATKKGSRVTQSCIIDSYIHSNKRIGVLLELCSETDFVSKHEDFKGLAHDLSMHIAASSPKDNEELFEQEFIKSPKVAVKDYIKQYIAKFGENITLERFIRYEV